MSHSFRIYNLVKELGNGAHFNSLEVSAQLPDVSLGAVSGALSRMVKLGLIRPTSKEGRAFRYEVLDAIATFNPPERVTPSRQHARGKALAPYKTRKLPQHESPKQLQDCLLRVAQFFDNPLANFTTLELQREIIRRMENNDV